MLDVPNCCKDGVEQEGEQKNGLTLLGQQAGVEIASLCLMILLLHCIQSLTMYLQTIL